MKNGWKRWRLNISEGNKKGKRKQRSKKERGTSNSFFSNKAIYASWSKDPFITFYFMRLK